MGVRVVDNSRRFMQVSEDVLDIALGRMAKDIKTKASIRVPFKEGTLQQSGKTEKFGPLKHRVSFNTEYAAYQERGQRMDGSHVVSKYSTPGTGRGYLQGAAEDITSKGVNYLKQANQLIKL